MTLWAPARGKPSLSALAARDLRADDGGDLGAQQFDGAHRVSKVLTETLRRLQFNGLIDRHAHPGTPARVEYELTPLGRTLLIPIDAVGAWAFEHGDEVMAAQEMAWARPTAASGELGRQH